MAARGRVPLAVAPDGPEQTVDLVAASSGALESLDAVVNWADGHPHSLAEHEVLIGSGAAEALGLGPVALDPVVFDQRDPLVVVGSIRSSRRLPSLVNAAVVSLQEGKGLRPLESSTLYLLTSPGAAPQVARQAPVALDAYAPAKYETQAPADPRSLRDEIQSDVRSTLLVLSILAAIAAVLGLANAMVLGVLERVGELGLRRAIGARPVHVLAQTSCESLLVGALGGVVGFTGGLAVVLAVTIVRGWTPVFDLRLAPLAVCGGLLVGALGGSFASLRASHIQPADALRQ